MTQSRSIGLNFIMSVFCLVWMADIAAYFGGRALGRRKLAPTISPGKSWEGVYSGVAGVLALALVWSQVENGLAPQSLSLFTRLHSTLGIVGALLALALLAGMSVVGDLMESLVKRAAGAKDSSKLLPGHGGVLDRVDALLPVFPLTLALINL
jgi:phosphatidate cytidylyltransferase